MVCKITSTKKASCAGMTLTELMVACVVGLMVLGAACSLYFYSYRSFAAQLNYVDLDQYSHKALDRLSSEIRQVKNTTAFTTNSISFTDYDDATLTYIYSPDSKTLARIKGTSREVLLTGCESLAFSIYQRNPVGGAYDQYPAADLATCKLVQVQWNCSRAVTAGSQLNTESMQSAKIVIRNP